MKISQNNNMKEEIKYIKMAELLFPSMSKIYKKIDEENFFAINIDKLLNINNNKFNEGTLRFVMFAYDIIVSKSENSYILRKRDISKDKTPFYWKKALRKLRINILKMKKNYEIHYCSDCLLDDKIFCPRNPDAICLICNGRYCGAHIGPHLKEMHFISLSLDHCRGGRVG